MLKNFKSNRVINAGFAVILLILIALTSASIYVIANNNRTISNIERKQNEAKNLFLLRNTAIKRALLLFQMTVMDDPFDRDDMYLAYSHEALNFINVFRLMRENDKHKEAKASLDEILLLANMNRETQDQAADLIISEKKDDANKMLLNQVVPTQNKVLSILKNQGESNQQYLGNEIRKIRELNLRAYWIIGFAGLAAVFLGLGIAITVSKYTKRNAELEIQKKTAEKANKSKTEFLANMSHELRTPIHAILSFSTFGIKKESAGREKIKYYFQNIHKSGARLLNLVTVLLDLAKLESGKVEYKFSNVDLGDTLNECLDGMSSLVIDKNIHVKIKVQDNLKTVECDEPLMHQVIQNLVSNAIKFSDEGSNIYIDIRITQGQNTSSDTIDVLRFTIEDEGIGIPDNELKTVFDKFIQSTHTSTGSGGTGLGLAICAEIISGHGGHIWAESLSGKGARFVFEVPLKQSVDRPS